MTRNRKLFINTVLLTATSLLMRSVGLTFQVYMSKRIGASGMGLFQLVMSVSMFAATFAISGIRFATTRLVAEEIGARNNDGVKKAVTRCIMYAVSFGTAAAFMLYFGAEYIGTSLIGDGRTILSLKILAISLPFMSMGSVMSGYFTAAGRVRYSAAAQVIEQVIRIGTILLVLGIIPLKNVEYACAAVVAGGVVGDIASFIIILFMYLYDKRSYPSGEPKERKITSRMLRIALPLAASAYARTALSTIQNLLVPRGFKKSGESSETALANYGMIQGMVFPVITFPHAFFSSLSEMLVPELTEAQVRGQKEHIETMVNQVLRLCFIFSIGVAGILFCFSRELGETVYKTSGVGRYIMLLAPLMPLLYMDSVTDGMLRGLGQHLHSMKYNIIDSLLCTILVWALLPRYAVMGYIFILYFSEAFNFILSIHRLSKLTKIRPKLWPVFRSLTAVIGAVSISVLALRAVGLPIAAEGWNISAHIVLSAVLYFALLCVFGGLNGGDRIWIRTFLEKGKKTP